MASIPIAHSADLRGEFFDRGGENAAKCYQCATCSSVCELAPANAPFPRRQVLLAQWGLFDQLMGDPAVWLCHQCNDCSVRCPRDVAPGDVMASLRAMVVEKLAFPTFLGSLVGNVKKTWPILVFGPILFWAILLGVTTGFSRAVLIEGIGYAASTQGRTLLLSVGFANQVKLELPAGVDVQLTSPQRMIFSGPDKQLVNNFAARVRAIRVADPYHQKGMRYEGETIRRKVGKAFASGPA